MIRLTRWLLVLGIVSLSAADEPDLILHHGRVVAVDPEFTIAEAVAVKAGRVTRLGRSADLLQDKGPATEVVDLEGRMVLPGLMDSHTHPTAASMFELDHPVPEMETIQDVLDYVRSRTAAVDEGEWIWVNQVFITRLREQRYPTRAELDAVAPRNPVVFSTGPDATVNSLALQLSGIDRDFQVVGAGTIEKDASSGEPTGILRGGTKRYLKSQSPRSRATEEESLKRLELLLRDYNSVGLTAIADRDASPEAIQRYVQLKAADRLPLRVAISHSVDANQELEAVQDAIRSAARHPLRQGDDRLRIVGVKTYQDGGMLTGSAYMREPWGRSSIYSITDPGYQGVLFIEPDKLREIVRTAVTENLQFTAHTVGDGAVSNLVQVYEELSGTLPVRATRPCITHCNFMTRQAVETMGRLGIVADLQPAWLYLDTRTLVAQFGYPRLRYFQPLSSLFQAGCIVGGGSDHMQKIGSLRAINPYNPFLAMWVTITRRAKAYDGQLHPEEALTREQAIRFYTINNAYLLFLEHTTGSLEPGKAADMIVLDRDLLTCPVDEIRDTQVLRTYLEGRLVYSRAR